jgi:hypothetical protein
LVFHLGKRSFVQYLKHCLNLKAITALVVIGAAIWAFALNAFAAALPTLAVAACALSMLTMMLLMRSSGKDEEDGYVSPKPSPGSTARR